MDPPAIQRAIHWATKFATFVRPHSPYWATAADVAAFLTELAVERRASPSTQKQVFPSRGMSVDPATGTRRRHHLIDTTFQNTIKRAAQAAKIDRGIKRQPDACSQRL